jgi:drug/metabolite transporter (DMT)-like permease
MWGANILVFKSAITDFNPWVFNAVRLTFATGTLGILAWAETRYRPRANASEKPVNWLRVLAFSFMSGFLYLVIFVKGIDLTTAGNTALILASMPMWTAILSFFFLRERLPQVTWIGLMVTFVGTAIVTTQGSGQVSLASKYFLGNIFMLIAAMTWATGTVMSRSILETISPLRLAFISSALTTPLHILLALSAMPFDESRLFEPTTMAAIIYSGVFSTGVAYATWHAGVRAVGGSHASVYQNVVTLGGRHRRLGGAQRATHERSDFRRLAHRCRPISHAPRPPLAHASR